MKRWIVLLMVMTACYTLQAQTGCPGCQLDLVCIGNIPQGGPCDTILPDAQVGQAYDYDVTFYMPPVLVGFPGAPGDVRLKRIKIIDVIKEPFGMQWESDRSGSNNEYFPQQGDTVGCLKICGSPLVPGVYFIDVVLEADVNVDIVGDVNNVAQVYDSIMMTVLPSAGGASSFTYSPTTGCDTTEIDFETTFPSNNIPGYSYNWDFGNGQTSTSETPPTQTYPPGVYEVAVTTTIDTIGYILESISITATSCNDCIFAGACTGLPAENFDPVIEILDNPVSGSPLIAYPEVPDAFLPVTKTIGGSNAINPLQNINYYIKVTDIDSNNADDDCGIISFNGHTEGTFSVTNGGTTIEITISHTVLELKDTVEIEIFDFPPSTNVFNLGPSDTICQKDTTIIAVVDDSLFAYQWFNDTTELAGATDTFLIVTQTGDYFVRRTNVLSGCSSYSDTLNIFANLAPPNPVILVNGANLIASNAGGWTVQWYLDGSPVPGANTNIYEPEASGDYSVEYYNSNTGCGIVSNELFFLYNSIADLSSIFNASVYPNPNDGRFFLEMDVTSVTDLRIELFDVMGRQHYNERLNNYVGSYRKGFGDVQLTAGIYLLKISANGEESMQKIIVR